MYNLARTDVRPITTQSIQETLDPFRSVYQLQSGNSYPWYGAKAYQPSFGKKKKRKKQNNNKAVAYCIKKNRVVGVYKKPGRKGRYYFNGTKVIKGKKCYKLKSKANAALKKTRNSKRRKSSSRSTSSKTYYYYIDGREKKQPSWKKGYSKTRSPSCNKYYNKETCLPAKAGCRWFGGSCVNKFGQSRFGSPASKYNYTLAQYANNASTPTDHLLGKISGTSAYSYPTNTPNYHFYTQRTNNSGYGF